MRRMLCTIGVWVILGTLFFLPRDTSFAEITEYRSAETITTDGDPFSYTGLSSCSSTDGQTCDRQNGSGYANLYFKDFGDFEIPEDATINDVRLRVTGMSTTAPYASVSVGREYASNCQNPAWLWQMGELQGSEIKVFTFNTPTSNGGLSGCLSAENIRDNNFIFRVNWSGPSAWSANIDNFEIAFDYTPPAPSPTPTPPEPFLDLPWDYQGKGMSFSTAATAINSYFDHEYPFLSTNASELAEVNDTVIKFDSFERTTEPYSSHDGYDWGMSGGAKVDFSDEVRAAASGYATRYGDCLDDNSNCGKVRHLCGNQIRIDHENGYETRYCHLRPYNLVSSSPTDRVWVEKGQKIGEVGYTGNIEPEGEGGSHIHFMVVFDKNGDGDFNNNIPDGLVDPFGWQSTSPDPWEKYIFDHDGVSKTGMKSTYLWTTPLGNLNEEISPDGEEVEVDNYRIKISENANNDESFKLIAFIIPVFSFDRMLGNLGPGISLEAFDLFGEAITHFVSPVTITIDFSEIDLSRYNPESISIYSSQDKINWIKETGTLVDLERKTASVKVNHFTYFMLMAERIDITPPTTSVVLNGSNIVNDKYASDVTALLHATDGDGLGVDVTFYQLNGGNWTVYTGQIEIHSEGLHTLNYYSVDADENFEETKNVKFSIDKTLPEANIKFDPQIRDFFLDGTDSSGSAEVHKDYLGRFKTVYRITDHAGNEIAINTSDITVGSLHTLTVDTLSYSNGSIFSPDRNILGVLYKVDKKKDITELVQTFYQKGKEVIIFSYNKTANKTKVFMKEKGKDKLVQELSGMKILQLYTERGTLKYRY